MACVGFPSQGRCVAALAWGTRSVGGGGAANVTLASNPNGNEHSGKDKVSLGPQRACVVGCGAEVLWLCKGLSGLKRVGPELCLWGVRPASKPSAVLRVGGINVGCMHEAICWRGSSWST
jgi:hypothetical protein